MQYKNIDINKRTVETYHSRPIRTLYKTSNKTSICNLNSCCWSNVQSFCPNFQTPIRTIHDFSIVIISKFVLLANRCMNPMLIF